MAWVLVLGPGLIAANAGSITVFNLSHGILMGLLGSAARRARLRTAGMALLDGRHRATAPLELHLVDMSQTALAGSMLTMVAPFSSHVCKVRNAVELVDTPVGPQDQRRGMAAVDPAQPMPVDIQIALGRPLDAGQPLVQAPRFEDGLVVVEEAGGKLKAELAKGITKKETMGDVFAEGL